MLEPISPQNVNTEEFWDIYMKNNWDQNTGRRQTQLFAHYFLEAVKLPDDASTLLDVSCAMGDALPEIHHRYPRLQLFGHDVSETAIAEARKAHSQIATFRVAGFEDLREHVDVIYCSNTLEHFEHYLDIADHLLSFCDWLYVQVPFKELRNGKPLKVEPGEQHVSTFNEDTFNDLVTRGSASVIRHWVRFTPGAWGTGKVTLWRKFKAVIRGWPIPIESRQIIYELRSVKARSAPPPSPSPLPAAPAEPRSASGEGVDVRPCNWSR
jgi:methyltransferase family protein